MNRRVSFAYWLVVAVVLTTVAGRALWLASRTETGFHTIRDQWLDAAVGSVLGSRIPIHCGEPIEQAELWLCELDRVDEPNSGDAEWAMGAAWVLDSPAPGFMVGYIEGFHMYPGSSNIPQLDDEAIEQAANAFESACKARCLELAATATQIDPTNVEWWRLRALLLWRHDFYSCDDQPRASNWPEILEECARHDPDNGLYDYLAANYYWQASAEIDFSGNDDRLLIKDPETFARGIEYFERGQTKPAFEIGDAGFTATAEFLQSTSTPLVDHPTIVNNRGVFLHKARVLRNVAHWQGLRAAVEATNGDYRAALDLHRQNVNLYRQFAAAGRSAAYDNILMACTAVTRDQLLALAT